jgi:hypothetical protein
MVKFLLPRGTGTRTNPKYYRPGNHARSAKSAHFEQRAEVPKILGKFASYSRRF